MRSSIVAAASLSAATTPHAQQAADGPAMICTDRPTRANFSCVVDPGLLQYEADLLNYSRLRLAGTTTETWLVSNPTLKYGIAQDVDVEANIAPWVIVRTRDPDGNTSTERGAGDLYLRVKWNLLPDGEGKLSMSALPYVKAPTARRGIGNGAVEGGVLFPTNYQLTDALILTTVPEFDALKDSDAIGHRSGRHFNTAQLVNLACSLPHDVTIFGELWGDWNIDPAATTRQFSADVAVSWAIRKDFQVDVGLNFGLNRITPGVQASVGISQKF